MELISIEDKIYELRGHRIMLDFDLASLYEVETKYLKRAVRANINRFPLDFMFELTKDEWEILRCKFCTSSWGGIRYMPFVFTEQRLSKKGNTNCTNWHKNISRKNYLADN